MRDGPAWSGAVVDLLDLHEGRLDFPVLDGQGVRQLLDSRPRIAIVGASSDPGRPSHGVLCELRDAGFDVVPVNPYVSDVAGLTCYPTVMDAVVATGPVDIVDVFRRPEACVEVARQAIEAGARCLWLQLGIANREAGRLAHEASLLVVMDRCTIIEARRAGLA